MAGTSKTKKARAAFGESLPFTKGEIHSADPITDQRFSTVHQDVTDLRRVFLHGVWFPGLSPIALGSGPRRFQPELHTQRRP